MVRLSYAAKATDKNGVPIANAVHGFRQGAYGLIDHLLRSLVLCLSLIWPKI
jgi:hypothetical protein